MNRKTAPTIILILIVLFILVQAGALVFVLTREGLGLIWNLIILVAPLAFIVALIAVYIERLREINDEEKEDLSNY